MSRAAGSYLGSVIFISFRDLDHSPVFQIICLVLGLMSMSTVFMTVISLKIMPALSAVFASKPKRVAPHNK